LLIAAGKGQPKIMGLIIGGAVIMVVLVAVVVIWRRKSIKRGYKRQLLPGEFSFFLTLLYNRKCEFFSFIFFERRKNQSLLRIFY